MKVTAKFVIAFLLGMTLVTGVMTLLLVEREVKRFQDSYDREASHIGNVLQDEVADVLQREGPQAVVRMLKSFNRPDGSLSISWVWFDARVGEPMAPRLPESQLPATKLRSRSVITRRPDGAISVYNYVPIKVNDPRSGGLEVVREADELNKLRNDMIMSMLALATCTVVISGVLMYVVGQRYVGSPLKQIVAKTREIGNGNLAARIDIESNDELGELAESFNDMCDALAAARERTESEASQKVAAIEQLRHADRLNTIGRLASGVAHELGTPLNVVSGRADLIASGKLSSDDVVASAQTIHTEADRMTNIIRQLLDFGRRRTAQRRQVDVRDVVRHAIDLMESLARKREINFKLASLATACPANIDAGQIEQVITNLLVNAMQAMPSGGDIHIEIDQQSAADPNTDASNVVPCIRIRVTDQGSGIAAEDLPHVFEPFYTTKQIGEGTGLGLSVSHGIVREHGGWIGVDTKIGKGACFSVYLPAGEVK